MGNKFDKLGVKAGKPIGSVQLKQIWDNYDKNGKGSISASMAHQFLKDLAKAIDAEYDQKKAEELIASSCNADGNFSFEQYVQLFRDFAKPARIALTDTLENAASPSPAASAPNNRSVASAPTGKPPAAPAADRKVEAPMPVPAPSKPEATPKGGPAKAGTEAGGAKSAKGKEADGAKGEEAALAKKYPARWRALQDLREIYDEDTSLRDITLDDDGNMVFFLVAPGNKKAKTTLLIPDGDKGEYNYIQGDDFTDLGSHKDIETALDHLVSQWDERNGGSDSHQRRDLQRSIGLRDSGVEDLAGSGEAYNDLAMEEQLMQEGRAKVEVLLDAVRNLHGSASAGLFSDVTGDITARIAVPLNFLAQPHLASAWGLKPGKPLVIECLLTSPYYIENASIPKISVCQSFSKQFGVKKLEESSSIGLEWQLSQRLSEWLKAGHWPPKDRNFFLSLITFVIDKINTCTQRCIICDAKLGFEMLKPSVCDKKICLYSHEQYGLGEDVAATVRDHADVIDFLISTCFAASMGDIRRFNPFPVAVEVKQPAGPSLSFMKGGATEAGAQNCNCDIASVNQALQALPAIKELQATTTSTLALKQRLDKLSPMLFPLFRWVLTSNRAHLVRLPDKYHLKAMSTPHQYVLLSSPPEKEAQFKKLKEKHGAFYAFHGSGFGNWHSILRIGLKNYSNTALMSAGAAYGPGIYLAADSGTSAGYAAAQGGWSKSMFAEGGAYLMCLALCEVIDYEKKYKANPYYVIPEEAHVMTRFFFVFNQGRYNCPNVKAASLQPPRMEDILDLEG